MGKRKGGKRFNKPRGLQPLAQQIQTAKDKLFLAKAKRQGKLSKRDKRMVKKIESGLERKNEIDAKTSKKILNLAKEQQRSIQESAEILSIASDDPELVGLDEEYGEDQEDVYEELEITPEDQAIMERLMGNNQNEKKRTLGDIIMQKMKEREEAQKLETEQESKFPPQLAAVYKDVGKIMTRYRSGKVPKALKAIPSMQNWEDILNLCEVDAFSNQAVFVLTRLLASNLNETECQKFYFNYLLPRVRWDISESPTKVLNCHLFNSLKKALYKPAAFFKGIVIPLIEDSQTTLREAAIISSVLNSSSIPMLHSAAAVLRIIQIYSGVKSFVLVAPGLVFLKVLVNKKYNFPQRVIDELVGFFYGFIEYEESDSLPVLWHQCVLVLLQRYRKCLNSEQKDAIRNLVKKHFHYQIGIEIRRELLMADKESD